MRKGEVAEGVQVAPGVVVFIYIDPDDTAMWQACRIEDDGLVWGEPGVIEMGPVTDIVSARLPGTGRLAVAYLKNDGEAYVRKGEYADDRVQWDREMCEEECWIVDPWPLRN